MNLTLEISKFNSPTAKQEVVYRVIENGKPIAAKHLDRAGNYIGAHVYKQPVGFSFELFSRETEPRGEVYGTAWVQSYADAEAKTGVDAFVNAEVFDWSAQSVFFKEAYKDEWFTQTNPPNYGDYVDQYFSDHLDQLHWDYEASVKCSAGDKGCGETPCICRLDQVAYAQPAVPSLKDITGMVLILVMFFVMWSLSQ